MTNRHTQKYQAFTIVELIVVVTVIALLVAASYFAFNAWRDHVATTEVTSDLNSLGSGMESAREWSNGYPALSSGTIFDGNDTTKSIFTQSSGVVLTYISGNSIYYCVNAQSVARPSVQYYLNTQNGNKEPKQGTCS